MATLGQGLRVQEHSPFLDQSRALYPTSFISLTHTAFAKMRARANTEGDLVVTEKNTFLHLFYHTMSSHDMPRSKSVPPTGRNHPQSPSSPLYALAVVEQFSVTDVQPTRKMSQGSQDFVMQEFPRASKYDRWESWMDNEDYYTVMIRNIPCSCKRQQVAEAIEELGFGEQKDFFYAPTRNGKTRGYAFVGFPDPAMTKNFAKAMTGHRFAGKSSSKIVTVVPASLQGYSENLQHFESSFVMMHKDAKPVFHTQPETN